MTAAEWKRSLGVMDRYETVQRLKAAIDTANPSAQSTSQSIAIAAETDAYNTSTSREEYEAACNTHLANLSAPPPSTREDDRPPSPTGIQIGTYENCIPIAEGLTSQVYRSGAYALKIITEIRPMEPHDTRREVSILQKLSHPNIITLTTSTKDPSSGLPILVFPYQPLTLATILSDAAPLSPAQTKSLFKDIFSALAYLHAQDIIHRDVKPSNILLSSASGPALLADFGTAWHPTLSASTEPPAHKVLEVGTTCYRAPETLFGNRAYGPSLDMWAAGTVLAECVRENHEPLFESRSGEEDGNQLGLILSMFKTLGTPTPENWPEACGFTTPPFKWYREFEGKGWENLVADQVARGLVSGLVVFESANRLTAKQALEHPYMSGD